MSVFASLGVLVPWLLATLRLLPVTLLLPVFGGRTLPSNARIPLIAVLAWGLTAGVRPSHVGPVGWSLMSASIREVSIGLLIALVLSTPFFAIEQAGRLIDTLRGSSTELTTLDGQGRASALSELLRWTFVAVFLGSGGLRAVLAVLAQSFVRWPLDAVAEFAVSPSQLGVVARFSAESLAATLTLASLGVMSLLAVEVAFALAARLSPALGQGGAALPAKLLAPLAALWLGLDLVLSGALSLTRHALSAAAGL
ncbi:MAG: flagellar biosynthetic protein FliR [Deltaproteobacteria bacterium]|nr:flagellar biosynthetic protein FliR [Deltaproteobacteria bacterium]